MVKRLLPAYFPTGDQIMVSAGKVRKRTAKPKKRSRLFPANGTVGKPMPFPTRMLAKLKYAETIVLQSAIVPILPYFFSANSLYDPNRSGTGHQPYGRDTYATIYNHYTVLNSKITVTYSQANGVLNAYTWGVSIEDDVSTTPTYDNWMERPNAKSVLLTMNAGAQQKPISKSWNRAERFPRDDTSLSLSSAMGTSPAEEEFFMLVVQAQTSGTALGTIYMTVQIEYTAEFYELQDLGNS